MSVDKEFSRSEVAKHNQENDLWTIIDSEVYNLTSFSQIHPGGLSVLLDKTHVAGKDSTKAFFGLHRSEVLKKYKKRLRIGRIKDEIPQIKLMVPGQLSALPYAEPSWLSKGWFSPYFKPSHYRMQERVRYAFKI